MNTKTNFRRLSLLQQNKRRAAQTGMLLLLLLLFALRQAQSAAFQDLDFEHPTFVPVPSPFAGSVDPVAALQGWTVFWGTNLAPFVLHDNMFLDSAGVSILGTATFQGNFTLLLQGGFSLQYPAYQSVAIAQTGLIPASARTLVFDAWLMHASSVERAFVVNIGGQNLPFYTLASNPNFVQYEVDVSSFAGQTQEIRFIALPHPPPGLPINNVYLDDIRFSSMPMQSQFSYTINNGAITITGFSGPGGAVVIPGTISGLPVTSIGASAFYQCYSLTNISIPNSVTNIGTSAFQSCPNLSSVTIPNGVSRIADQTFQACCSLTSVTLPNSVNSIGTSAFYQCYSLTNVSLPVGLTSIGGTAFYFCINLRNLTLPNSVTTIGNGAFAYCTNLTSIYFSGNAPSIGSGVFDGDNNATVYYLPGTTGWGPTFGGRPTALWNPQVPIILRPPGTQTTEIGSAACFSVHAVGSPLLTYQWFFNDSVSVGSLTTNSVLTLSSVQPSQAGSYTVVVSNLFGAVTSAPAFLSVIAPVPRRTVPALTLTGQEESLLNLDSRTSLEPSASWETIDAVALTNAPQWYFDLTAPLAPQRFYRAWQTNFLSPPSVRDVHLVPAITLTGAIGSSVRVDYINQFGPIDAWVTNLATVTLTNTSQLYFDTSVIGQPARLWRIVPVP